MSESRDSVFVRLRRRISGDRGAGLRGAELAIRKLSESQRDQEARTLARLAELRDLVTQRSTGKDANEILHAIRGLGKQLRRAGVSDPADGAEDQTPSEARLHKALDELARTNDPILVGPWTGEVGFELLYWIPFLAWARERWRLTDDRFVIVSRGGTASWYGVPGAAYVDIFSMVTPDEFRSRTDPDAHKQRTASAFDEHLAKTALERLGIASAGHLHPSLMYRNLVPFWQGEAGFGTIEKLTLFRRLDPADDPAIEGLPRDYIAARFYFSDCFPDNDRNRAFARSVIEGVASRMPVVLLAPGLRIDDHADYATEATGQITTITPGTTPERNLSIQSSVISRAKGFIGTYGGFSYLAPLYGVPAVAFYSDRVFQLHHLHVAQWALDKLDAGTILPIDVRDAALVHATTGVPETLGWPRRSTT